MELAAVIVDSGSEGFTPSHKAHSNAPHAFENSRWSYSWRMPILGNELLHSWIDRIRELGVKHLWLISIAPDENRPYAALAGFAQQGIERFLMIKLRSYAEMDLSDLLRFHRERRNSVTEAQDAQGHLGVSLLDQIALQPIGKRPGSLVENNTGRIPYSFRGYAKRILRAKERQELVGDTLTGACAMRPRGKQTREQVWVGEGAEIADSVRFVGPAYIGARTRILSGATIGPFASVENDCVVDCGTAIEHSTVLPHTYLAPGLLIRDSVVNGGYLEHLRWSAVADLHPGRLGRKIERAQRRTLAVPATASDDFSNGSNPYGWDPSTSTSSGQWRQVQL